MRNAHSHCGIAALLAAVSLLTCGPVCSDGLPGSLPLRRDAEVAADGGPWMPSALLLGLGLAAGGYVAWRRRARRQPHPGGRWGGPAVARLSSQALTPHASVHAVQWNGEEFLLACTTQQVTVLAHRPVAADQGGTP
jgi:hypothetical protein